jgi:lipopolysaccharide export system permease protein
MILYRYIIKEHIFPFLAALSIIVFYFIMQQAVMLLDKIISKGLDPRVVLEVFIIQLGWIIALAIPMAILTASLTVFGRMSGDNEITSIKASGQSLFPLLMPVFAAAAVMCVLLIFFNDLILPDANHRTANLLSDISRKRPAAFIEPKVLIHDFAGYTIYSEEVNARNGDLRRIRIFCDLPGQDPSTTVAARGTLKMTADQQYLELTLYDGETHSISRQSGNGYFMGRFSSQVTFIKNIDSKLERTNSSYRSDREMSSQAMLTEIAQLRSDNAASLTDYHRLIDSLSHQLTTLDLLSAKNRAGPVQNARAPSNFSQWAARLTTAVAASPAVQTKVQQSGEIVERTYRRVHSNDLMISQFWVEVHKKYAIPLACIVFVLIGAPLGIMARRGGLTVGASYSVFFFVAYWAFLMGGESLGDKMIVSPAIAMWSGNIVIGICGVILMILMLRETTIRWDALLLFWRKFAGGNSAFGRRLSSSAPGHIIGLTSKGPKWLLKRTIGTLPMYLISLFSGYVVGVLCALLAMFVVIDYVSNIKQFEPASVREVGLYYWYYLPWIIQISFPIVLLLASMFAIGKLAKHSEIIAMKAAGVGIRRLTFPLLFLGVVLSVGMFYGSEKIIPKANILRKELIASFREPADSPMRKHVQKGKNGIQEFRRNFYYFGNQTTMYMYQEFNTSPQVARNVWREIFDTSSLKERIQAETMLYDSTGWRFVHGTVRRFNADGASTSVFDTLRDSVLKAPPEIMVARIKSIEEMSYWELRSYIDATKRRGEQVRKYMGELEFKIALPLMNFIVILLGIAITARAGRKGSAVLFGIGLLMVFAYWLISRFAIVFAQNGSLPTWIGAWIGNTIFFILGLILYRKASR